MPVKDVVIRKGNKYIIKGPVWMAGFFFPAFAILGLPITLSFFDTIFTSILFTIGLAGILGLIGLVYNFPGSYIIEIDRAGVRISKTFLGLKFYSFFASLDRVVLDGLEGESISITLNRNDYFSKRNECLVFAHVMPWDADEYFVYDDFKSKERDFNFKNHDKVWKLLMESFNELEEDLNVEHKL